MNILSFFVIIPLLMLGALWAARNINQVRGVMVVGSTLLLALSVYLTIDYLALRQAGETAEMLYTASTSWYAPLHICYSVGVDGISVAMLLLSSIIVKKRLIINLRLIYFLRAALKVVVINATLSQKRREITTYE